MLCSILSNKISSPFSQFESIRTYINFTALLSTDPEERSSYVKGAVAVPIILGVVFATWTLATLVVLPCLGQKRVGFWAGSGFVIRNTNHNCDANDSSAGPPSNCSSTCKANPQRPKYVKILCSVCLVILIISIITLVVLGFNQLKKSAFLIVTSTVDTDILIQQYAVSLQSLENFTKSLQIAYQRAVEGALNECAIPGSALSNFTQAVGIANIDFAVFYQFIEDASSTNMGVQSMALKILTYFKYSYLYWIPLLLITCLTLLSLCLVWGWEEDRTKKIVCLNRFIGTPLFVFWNVLSWILLVCFLAGLAVNADACSGYGSLLAPISPPNPLGTLLAAYYNLYPVSGTTPRVSQLMLYYFGCVTNFPGYFEEYYLKYFTILVAGLELLNLVGSQPKLPPNWNSTAVSLNSTLTSTLSSWIETAVFVNSTSTFNATSVCKSEGVDAFLGLATAVQNSLINSGAYITAFVTWFMEYWSPETIIWHR